MFNFKPVITKTYVFNGTNDFNTIIVIIVTVKASSFHCRFKLQFASFEHVRFRIPQAYQIRRGCKTMAWEVFYPTLPNKPCPL